MGWRMKAILGLLIVLETVNCAQLSLKDARIDDLEGQQIINRSRLENWQTGHAGRTDDRGLAESRR